MGSLKIGQRFETPLSISKFEVVRPSITIFTIKETIEGVLCESEETGEQYAFSNDFFKNYLKPCKDQLI